MDWLRPSNFTRAERIWVGGFFLGAVALSLAPYLYFFFSTPPNQVYTWSSVFYYDDTFQYYAWARRSAGGDWLIRNYYTASPEASFALFNLYFLLQGWATRLAGNMYFAHHFLRLAALGVFSWVSYAWIALFLNQPRLRRAAQLLMLGGGIEYLYWQLAGRDPTPLADPYVYKLLYRYGHLTAALSIMLMIFGTHVAAISLEKPVTARAGRQTAAMCAALALVLGAINPYYLVLVGLVVGVHGVAAAASGNFRGLCAPLGVAIATPAIYVHYRGQPLSANLGSISFDDPVGALDIFLFFSLLLPFAAAGWFSLRRLSGGPLVRAPAFFLLVWGVVMVALVLSPMDFRARMTFGFTLPLAIGAAAFLGERKFSDWRHWPLYALLLADAVYTFRVEASHFKSKGVGRLDRAMIEALEYLDENAAEGDLVFCLADTGNFVPAYSSAHVYIGHSFQTNDYYEKQTEAMRFFSSMTEAERESFLEGIGARYLFVGPEERALEPGNESGFGRVAFERESYRIIEVSSPSN